jgi:hypothetical protein
MKCLTHNGSILVATLLFAGAAVAADDLDTALEAQKKKLQRRVYSERAILDDQGLTVPKATSENELALDQKLREMDAQADSIGRVSDPAAFNLRAPAAPVRPAAENQNWLTPALLDGSAALDMPSNDGDWLANEVGRQTAEKEQAARIQEQDIVDRLVRKNMQEQSSFPEQDRLNPPQLMPQSTRPLKESSPILPNSSLTLPGTVRPQTAFSPKTKQPQSSPPLFSPQAAKNASAPTQDSLRQSRPSAYTSPFSKPSAGFSSGLNNSPEPALSPLQRIKQSSPINRADPFANDPMPQFKNSIWD